MILMFPSDSRRAPRWRRLSVVAIISIVASLLVGCSSTKDDDAGKLKIVAEIYPFQYLAENIAGDLATIETLTPAGASAHGYELSPQQTADVNAADLVIYQQAFQASTDEAIRQSGKDNSLDVGTTVELIPYQSDNSGGSFSGKKNDYDFDTHTWLSPKNMIQMGKAVSERLIEIDPDHADQYRSNTEAFVKTMSDLDQKFASGLAQCQRREFIPSHTAFGYLARDYNLVQIPIAGLVPDQEPSPARIAEIAEMTKKYKITTIFYETLVSPALSLTIANDLHLATDVLDPAAGITDQSRGKDYLEIQLANLEALRKANGCR